MVIYNHLRIQIDHPIIIPLHHFGSINFQVAEKTYLFIFSYGSMLFVQRGCDLGFLIDTKKLNFLRKNSMIIQVHFGFNQVSRFGEKLFIHFPKWSYS